MEPENIILVEDIFRAVFELAEPIPIDTIMRNKHEYWDSMAHVALISALDDEFDLVISVQDAIKITSFHSCVSIIEDYLEK